MENFYTSFTQIKNNDARSEKEVKKPSFHMQKVMKINLINQEKTANLSHEKIGQFLYKPPSKRIALNNTQNSQNSQNFAFTINKLEQEINSPTKLGEKTPQFNQATEFKSQKFQDCVSSYENQANNSQFSPDFITSILEENQKLQQQLQKSNQTINFLIRKAQTPEITSTGLKQSSCPNKPFYITNQAPQKYSMPAKYNKKTVSAILGKSGICEKQYLNANRDLKSPELFAKIVPKINFQLPPINLQKSKTPMMQLKKKTYFPKNDCDCKSDNCLPSPDQLEKQETLNKQYLCQNYQLAPPKKESKIALIKKIFASKPHKKFL